MGRAKERKWEACCGSLNFFSEERLHSKSRMTLELERKFSLIYKANSPLEVGEQTFSHEEWIRCESSAVVETILIDWYVHSPFTGNFVVKVVCSGYCYKLWEFCDSTRSRWTFGNNWLSFYFVRRLGRELEENSWWNLLYSSARQFLVDSLFLRY